MSKTLSVKCIIMLIGTLACLPAMAQNAAPTPPIGSAPANSKQDKIISGALSPQTRQTLQEAMDSSRAADTTRTTTPSK